MKTTKSFFLKRIICISGISGLSALVETITLHTSHNRDAQLLPRRNIRKNNTWFRDHRRQLNEEIKNKNIKRGAGGC